MIASRLSLVLIAVAVAAPSQLSLQTTDGKTTAGASAGLDAEGRLLWRTNDATTPYPLDRVIGFESTSPEVAPAPGGVRAILIGGDVLYGRIEDGPADELRLVVAGLGSL